MENLSNYREEIFIKDGQIVKNVKSAPNNEKTSPSNGYDDSFHNNQNHTNFNNNFATQNDVLGERSQGFGQNILAGLFGNLLKNKNANDILPLLLNKNINKSDLFSKVMNQTDTKKENKIKKQDHIYEL